MCNLFVYMFWTRKISKRTNSLVTKELVRGGNMYACEGGVWQIHFLKYEIHNEMNITKGMLTHDQDLLKIFKIFNKCLKDI